MSLLAVSHDCCAHNLVCLQCLPTLGNIVAMHEVIMLGHIWGPDKDGCQFDGHDSLYVVVDVGYNHTAKNNSDSFSRFL